MYTIETHSPAADATVRLLAFNFKHISAAQRSTDTEQPMDGQLYIRPAAESAVLREQDLPAGWHQRPDAMSELFWVILGKLTRTLCARGNIDAMREYITPPVGDAPIDIMVYLHRNYKVHPQPVSFDSTGLRFNFVYHDVEELAGEHYISLKDFFTVPLANVYADPGTPTTECIATLVGHITTEPKSPTV